MESEEESESPEESIAPPDAPDGEIDWLHLLEALARSARFDDMLDPIYDSGVLISGYNPILDDAIDALVGGADLYRLRSLLTAIVRRDRFADGLGDFSFRNGDIDLILDAIGTRVGVAYSLQPSTHKDVDCVDILAPRPDRPGTDRIEACDG